jgi:hypothetical protein
MSAQALPVVYRFIQGEVLAIFPTLEANPGRFVCYAHVGQHSEASCDYARSGRLATEAEYSPLHGELSGIYAPEYTLAVKKKIEPYARLGKYERHALNFGRQYPGWHCYSEICRTTKQAVKSLARKGLVELNEHHQFRVA